MVCGTQDICVICLEEVNGKQSGFWFAFQCKDPICGESAEVPMAFLARGSHNLWHMGRRSFNGRGLVARWGLEYQKSLLLTDDCWVHVVVVLTHPSTPCSKIATSLLQIMHDTHGTHGRKSKGAASPTLFFPRSATCCCPCPPTSSSSFSSSSSSHPLLLSSSSL